jgi:periplasmic divalent cation tolerance protein
MAAMIAYITAPDRDEALRIGKTLVEARLAACINVLGEVQSVYWWKGRMEESRECGLLAKTDSSRAEALISKVKELHSYDVPCVVLWPLPAGNPDYLGWIEKECGNA